MRTNAGRITLIQIKLKRWHDCSPPNAVVWITDRSYCRTSPGSSGVQLECLMKPKLIGCIRFLCIARKKNRKKTTRLPSCGQANKIKESPCGLSLANNEDRQKIEIQCGFTTKTWGKKTCIWRGSAQRKPRSWGQALASCPSTTCLPLSHLWNTSFLSDETS